MTRPPSFSPATIWIVIADKKQARFLQTSEANFSDLQEVGEIEFPACLDLPDCKSSYDAAPVDGANCETLTSHFASLILNELEQGRLDREFHRVILIASKEILQHLQENMSASLLSVVDTRLDLDTMREPTHIIRELLRYGASTDTEFNN